MSAVLQSEVPVNPTLARAAEILGSQAKLAEAIGVTPQMVSHLMNGMALHERHCPAIEHATGEQVKCEDLRPDLLWVRGDSGEILGFITPVDNANPQYIRASLMALVRQQVNEVIEDPVAWLPEGFLQGGTITTSGGHPFYGMNGKYAPRAGCFEEIAADAARLVSAGGQLLHEVSDNMKDPLWAAWQLFEMAGQAINYLHQAGHFARLDTEKERLAYVRGCMNGMSEEAQVEFMTKYAMADRIRSVTGEDEFKQLAWMAWDEATQDLVEYHLSFGHAYGIMHAMTSAKDDDLCHELIMKYGLDKDGSESKLSVNARLEALYHEVQGILAKRAPAPSPAPFDPLELTDAGNWSPKDHTCGEWSPRDAAEMTVDRCLNDASCMLTEADSVIGNSDVSSEQSAGLRLINMAHVLVELSLRKLSVAARGAQEARA